MLEDQRAILHQILELAKNEKIDAVLLAGDVYDKPYPPAEAVGMLDDFLTELARNSIQSFVISGNHDSAERIAFGGRLMDQSGVHMARVFDGTLETHTLRDEYGELQICLLPFVKPATVRHFIENRPIESYTDAVRAALDTSKVTNMRRVLVAHQFVAGGARCDSEEVSAGGLDAVDGAVFDGFDYVALGHLHGPQSVGRETVRYCGTPLKYSLSEAGHKKSVTIVELREKGKVSIETRPLHPLRDLRAIRGSYLELTALEYCRDSNVTDYIHAILTDENEIPDALARLRTIYPNIMSLAYDNTRTRTRPQEYESKQRQILSPFALFGEFYQERNGAKMSAEQEAWLHSTVDKIWEETE